MHRIDLATAAPDMLGQVLAANAAVAAMTSPLDMRALESLLTEAAFAAAMVDRGDVMTGFLIGFGPGAAYDSLNYRWFGTRFDRFAYVDRVVTVPAAQGRGVARRLYAAFADAMPQQERLVCEVNLLPPNPGSDAFHAALGFREVGRGSPSPGKQVRYLAKPIDAAAGADP